MRPDDGRTNSWMGLIPSKRVDRPISIDPQEIRIPPDGRRVVREYPPADPSDDNFTIHNGNATLHFAGPLHGLQPSSENSATSTRVRPGPLRCNVLRL